MSYLDNKKAKPKTKAKPKKIETPKYTILQRSDGIELRRYDAQIAAQTTVTGDQANASRAGFKILADYIFGNNTANNGNASKIAMTAPVVMAEKSGAKTIDMTAPVLLQSSDEDNENKADDANKRWQMQFIMPSQYDLSSLPKPNNPAVTLVEVPVKTFAVIEFSGRATPKQMAAKTAQLQNWLNNQKLEAISAPKLARYDPPWTLPMLRRNEILIEYKRNS